MSMMHIFVITLHPESEQLKKTMSQFPKYAQYFTIIQAIYGDRVYAKEYFEYILKSNKSLLITPAQVGTALSHIRALKSFLATKEQIALILEDDVIGNDMSIEHICNVASKIDGEFFLHCGGQYNSKIYAAQKAELPHGEYEIPRFAAIGLTCAQCYAVTRKAAEQVLKKQREAMLPADLWYYFFKDSNINIYFTGAIWHIDLYKTSIKHSSTELETKLVTQLPVIGISQSSIVKLLYKLTWKPIEKVVCEMQRFIIRIRAYSVSCKRVYEYKLEAVPGTIGLVKEMEKYLIVADSGSEAE